MAEKKRFTDQMREMFSSLPLDISSGDREADGGFDTLDTRDSGAVEPVEGADHAGAVLVVPMTENPLENSRGKKMVPVAVPQSISAETFRRAVAGAYRAYLETGRVVIDDVARISGIDKSRLVYISQQDEFAYALSVRGINTEEYSGLTAEQDAALLVLTDTTANKTWNQKMRAAGLSQAKFNAWMKNPAFARALSGVAEATIANHNTALLELGRKAGDGDLKAIQMQLAISGRYDANQQSTVDALVLINKMMEVLSRHLAGQPEILMAISKDMREIGQEVSQVNRPQFGGF